MRQGALKQFAISAPPTSHNSTWMMAAVSRSAAMSTARSCELSRCLRYPSFVVGLQCSTNFQKISTNGKCRLSDGYVSLKAKLTSAAIKGLEEDERDLSYLQRGMLLSVPEMQIRVTPLGKMDERVQLLVNHAKVIDSMRHGTFGNPEDVTDLPGVKRFMTVLNNASREGVDDIPSFGPGGRSGGSVAHRS